MEVNSLNAINNGVNAGNIAPPMPMPVQPQRSAQTQSAPVELPTGRRAQPQRVPGSQRTDEAEFPGERQLTNMMNRAISEANRRLAPSRSELRVSVHEGTNDIMVVVKDSETGDIIREVPPERVLDAIASAWELAGLFVDESM